MNGGSPENAVARKSVGMIVARNVPEIPERRRRDAVRRREEFGTVANDRIRDRPSTRGCDAVVHESQTRLERGDRIFVGEPVFAEIEAEERRERKRRYGEGEQTESERLARRELLQGCDREDDHDDQR